MSHKNSRSLARHSLGYAQEEFVRVVLRKFYDVPEERLERVADVFAFEPQADKVAPADTKRFKTCAVTAFYCLPVWGRGTETA